MANTKQKRLVALLNQSAAANLPAEDQLEIENLMQEYFIDDAVEDKEEDVSQFEADDELADHQPTDDSAKTSVDDDEDEAPPLIHEEILTAAGEAHCSSEEFHNLAGNYVFPTVDAAAEFACKCKQIKVAAEADLCPEQRRENDSSVMLSHEEFVAGIKRHGD